MCPVPQPWRGCTDAAVRPREITAAVDAVVSGTGRILNVEGVAGIGKSALGDAAVTLALAAGTGCAIAVDDAHRADQRSRDYLRNLAHRINHVPILHAAAVGLAEQALQAQVAVLIPRLLGADAMCALTRERLPGTSDALCEACTRTCQGNPLLLHELRRALPTQAQTPVALLLAAGARSPVFAPRRSEVAPRRRSGTTCVRSSPSSPSPHAGS